MYIHIYIYIHVCIYVCIAVYLSIHLSICLSIHLSIYLSDVREARHRQGACGGAREGADQHRQGGDPRLMFLLFVYVVSCY